jgi:predicted nucleic-acid-binding protein
LESGADLLHLEKAETQILNSSLVGDRRGNGIGTFEDALICSLGLWRGCSATLTFDEDAAKRLHGFQLA